MTALSSHMVPPPSRVTLPNILTPGMLQTDQKLVSDGLYRRVYQRLNKMNQWIEDDGIQLKDVKDDKCAFTIYSRRNPPLAGSSAEFDSVISIDSDCLKTRLRCCLPSLVTVYASKPLVNSLPNACIANGRSIYLPFSLAFRH
jgi:hypothetical protein